MQEKEFYKGSILGMLENLGLEKLEYIYAIVADVAKETTEKSFLKNGIVELLDNIDSIDMLVYFYAFISKKMKLEEKEV